MKLKDETGKGYFTDAFSLVPHASGLLAIATENDMFTNHVDISQAFTQGELQPGDGYVGNLYISAPPGFPVKQEGCTEVSYEESMWKTTIQGFSTSSSHIDDFITACQDSLRHVGRFRVSQSETLC